MIVHPLTDAELAARTDLQCRDDVERLVVAFYRYAAMDELLGPIFSAAHVDWPSHIDKLTDFWAWQLLGERGYEGNPLRAHEPVHAHTPFEDAHFERWLDLFVSTIDEQFAGPTAEMAKGRAKKMASAMRRLLLGQFGAPTEPMQPIWTAAPTTAPAAGDPATTPSDRAATLSDRAATVSDSAGAPTDREGATSC